MTDPANLDSLLASIAELERRVAELTDEREERRRAEANLARELRLLMTVIDHVPGCVYAKDRQSRFVLANQATCRTLGLASMSEIVGKLDRDVLPVEVRESADKFYVQEQRLMETGEALVNEEEPLRDPVTGQTIWTMSTKVPVREASGAVVGLVGLTWDISVRHRAVEAAREAAIREEVIRSQTALLDALSTPLLAIGPRTLLLPLIGALGKERSRKIVEVLCHGVAQQRAAFVILDLTGVEGLDAEGASVIAEAAGVTRLLGAELLVSGIGPALAPLLAGRLEGVKTFGVLERAVAATLR
jgi:rsbT co-antagonist protein RsbR